MKNQICKICGSPTAGAVTVCIHCGRKISNVKVSVPEKTEERLCPMCGAKLDREQKYCPSCGANAIDGTCGEYEKKAQIERELRNKEEEQAKIAKTEKGNTIGGTILSVLAFVCALILFFIIVSPIEKVTPEFIKSQILESEEKSELYIEAFRYYEKEVETGFSETFDKSKYSKESFLKVYNEKQLEGATNTTYYDGYLDYCEYRNYIDETKGSTKADYVEYMKSTYLYEMYTLYHAPDSEYEYKTKYDTLEEFLDSGDARHYSSYISYDGYLKKIYTFESYLSDIHDITYSDYYSDAADSEYESYLKEYTLENYLDELLNDKSSLKYDLSNDEEWNREVSKGHRSSDKFISLYCCMDTYVFLDELLPEIAVLYIVIYGLLLSAAAFILSVLVISSAKKRGKSIALPAVCTALSILGAILFALSLGLVFIVPYLRI